MAGSMPPLAIHPALGVTPAPLTWQEVRGEQRRLLLLPTH